jgi:membrane fusion protein (multidrug efflux system)
MAIRQIFIATALALVAAATTAQGPPGRSTDPPGVVVAVATEQNFPLAVEALGNAYANEAVEIRPEISAKLTSIQFQEGEMVDAGQVLAELENVEPLAEVATARANMVEIEAQYKRLKQLSKTQAVSESQMQQLQAQREAARAAWAAAEARLEDTVIRAPFAGRLGLRRISVGSVVTPSTVITTLDDTSSIKLDFDVPEVFLARVSRDVPVIARSAAWPDVAFEGAVTSVDSRVDPVTRTVKVRSEIPNAEGRLRAGMFLTVVLRREINNALMVPEAAISPDRSTQAVFVVVEGDTAEKRLVKTGRRRPGQVEIIDGLSPGERVIVQGTQKARPGQPVRVIETQEDGA